MRILHTRQIAIVILLSVALAQPACDKNRIHEAAKASDRIATLVGSMIDLKRDLAQSGQITAEEELAITNRLLEVNTRAKQFNDFARKLTEDTPQSRLDLATAFNQVTTAITKLSNESLFPIKNPEAKKRLLAILNSINVSVQIIDLALRG